jgi:hypothetical protein
VARGDRSFERLLSRESGFSPDGLLTMRVPIPQQLVPNAEGRARTAGLAYTMTLRHCPV